MNERSMQFLTFKIDDEQYAVEVERVREVLEYSMITKLPKSAERMRGVINIRGSVVPVMDLRIDFGLSATEQTITTAIIVLEYTTRNGIIPIGILADSVQEVITMNSDQIDEVPAVEQIRAQGFIKGFAKKEDGFIVLLDIDKVFTEEAVVAA